MWKSSSYEVVGRAHLKTGTVCQDRTLCLEQDGVSVIALADGAGSAKDSEQGALAAIHTASQYVIDHFETLYLASDGEAVKSKLSEAILLRLEAVSQELGCRLGDLASTLLLVAVKDDRFLLTHVGDGVIGYVLDEQLKVASSPHNGEFANETVFTTSQGVVSVMRVVKGDLAGISGFVLMSDGSAASLYNRSTMEFAKPVMEVLNKNRTLCSEKTGSLIRHLFDEFIVKRTTDDCSIAVLSKCG